MCTAGVEGSLADISARMSDKSRVSLHLRRPGVADVAGAASPDWGTVGVVGHGIDTLRSVVEDDRLENGLNCLDADKEGGGGLWLLLVDGDAGGLD